MNRNAVISAAKEELVRSAASGAAVDLDVVARAVALADDLDSRIKEAEDIAEAAIREREKLSARNLELLDRLGAVEGELAKLAKQSRRTS